MQLTVLYEDNHIIAVYKPAGVLVQPDSPGGTSIMDDIKKERYIKLLHQNAAAFISSISTRASLITVTKITLSKGEKKEILLKFSSVFRQIVFLIVPISAISFILRAHLVRVVFGAGRFDWSATKLTAACFGSCSK